MLTRVYWTRHAKTMKWAMSGTFVENIQNIVNVTRDKLKNLKPLLSTIAILLLFVIKKP